VPDGIDFLLDDSGLTRAIDAWESENRLLLSLLATLEELQLDGSVKLRATEDIYQLPLADAGACVADFIFPEVPQDRDLWRRLMLAMSKVSLDFTAPSDVSCALEHIDEQIDSRAIAFAVEQSSSGGDFPVLLTIGIGPHSTRKCEAGGKSARLAFIEKANELMLAYRAFLLTRTSDEQVRAAIPDAYPSLHVCDDATVKALGLGFSNCLQDYLDHLSWLNDELLDLAAQFNWDLPKMINAARIPFSDESTSTKADPKKMRERQVHVNGKAVICSLHTKITHTKGRIHFHPPISSLVAGKVIVGLTAPHLSV
jgi:hypothetical protein